ncbi:MAG TPA: dehydrogenase, partial [Planctomycetaceae bacterium]|nr:dehydrogenase [Planctomycetaceae bacterium]
NLKLFFNGQNLAGWTGNSQLWSVENGEIVGRSPGIKQNEFLVSDLQVGDFELKLKVKLTPNTGNSGIQFRSSLEPGGHVKGYQADAGKGWWGKLYEEHGRGLLFKNSGEAYVREGEWNEYRIVAVGPQIRTFINGNLCTDLNDPQGAKTGIIAFQIHSGGPMEVRFKDLELNLAPKTD